MDIHILSTIPCHFFPLLSPLKDANQYLVYDIILQQKGCPSDKEIAPNE